MSDQVAWRNRIKETRIVTASELAQNASNFRRHPEPQAQAVRGLLSEVGIVAPLIAYASERAGGALTLIDGHLRQEAGGEWPVTILDVSDSEADLILALLDFTTSLAELDGAALAELLGRVEMTPVEDDGVRDLLAMLAAEHVPEPVKTDVDAEPQVDRGQVLREQWNVNGGDLWQLGEHKIICGDCTDPLIIARLLGEERPDLIIADPPYGVSIVATNVSVGGGEGPNGIIPFGGVKKVRGHVGGGEAIKASPGLYPIQTWKKDKRLGTANGAKPFGSKDVRGSVGAANLVDVGKYAPIIGDDTTDTALKASSFYLEMYPKAVQVWWGANYYVEGLGPSSCWLVWDKETTGNFADCELAWTNQDKAAKLFRHRWNGMLRDSERERRWHPTQKPAALAAWVYEQFTEPGAIVLDPFAGAGWAVLGGEQTGRKVRAIEMSEDYIAIMLQRYADATGQQPTLLEAA